MPSSCLACARAGWEAAPWSQAELTLHVSSQTCGDCEGDCTPPPSAAVDAPPLSPPSSVLAGGCPRLSRHVRLLLYRPSTEVLTTTFARDAPSPLAGNASARVSVHITSSVQAVVTTTNLTTGADSEPGSAAGDSVSSTTTTRAPVLALVLLTPMPPTLVVRQPAEVTLRVTTEAGLPVPGQRVEAIALAARGSRVRLRADGAASFTDTTGLATLSISFEAGVNGTCARSKTRTHPAPSQWLRLQLAMRPCDAWRLALVQSLEAPCDCVLPPPHARMLLACCSHAALAGLPHLPLPHPPIRLPPSKPPSSRSITSLRGALTRGLAHACGLHWVTSSARVSADALLFVCHAVIQSYLGTPPAARQAAAWASATAPAILSSLSAADPMRLSGGLLRTLGQSSLQAAAANVANEVLAPAEVCLSVVTSSATASQAPQRALECLQNVLGARRGADTLREATVSSIQSASLSALLPFVLFRELPGPGAFLLSLARGFAFFSALRAVQNAAAEALTTASDVTGQLTDLARLGGGLELLRDFALPAPLEFTLVNEVASAQLSAPIVGYAAAASDAATVASAGMSSCALEGFPRYVPSIPVAAADSLNLLGPPLAPSEARPTLWQPYPFSVLNVFVDRQEFFTLAPRMCQESFLGDGMQAPQALQLQHELCANSSRAAEGRCGADENAAPLPDSFGPDPYPYASAPYGGLEGLSALFERGAFEFDPLHDCTGSTGRQALLSRLNGSADSRAVAEALQRTGWDGCRAVRFQSDRRALLGNDVAGPAPSSVAPRPPNSAQAHRRLWRAAARVHVSNQTGQPLSGRRCQVIVEDEVLQWERLRVHSACVEDPTCPGSYLLTDLVLSGGGSRERLDLRMLIDGVDSTLAAESWWSAGTTVEYISQQQSMHAQRLNPPRTPARTSGGIRPIPLAHKSTVRALGWTVVVPLSGRALPRRPRRLLHPRGARYAPLRAQYARTQARLAANVDGAPLWSAHVLPADLVPADARCAHRGRPSAQPPRLCRTRHAGLDADGLSRRLRPRRHRDGLLLDRRLLSIRRLPPPLRLLVCARPAA